MGNQCCGFKGKKANAEDAYSRTSLEHMSVEKMAEDRVKKSQSSSNSEKRRSEEKANEISKESNELSKEELDRVDVCPVTASKDHATKEETERAGGGRVTPPSVVTTLSVPIMDDTPKRPPALEGEEMEMEDNSREIETARTSEEIGISLNTTPTLVDDFGEEGDTVGEIVPSTYDLRPIRPLPTPLRKVDITPTRRIEMFCDERGRVRRNEKILRYLDDKRKSYEGNLN